MLRNEKFQGVWKVIWLCIACLLIVYNAYFVVRSVTVLKTGEATEATVSKVERVNSRYSHGYKIWIDYYVGGTSYKQVYLGKYTSKRTVGASLVVYYDPRHPNHIADPKRPLYGEIIMIVIFGVYCVITGKRILKETKEKKQ